MKKLFFAIVAITLWHNTFGQNRFTPLATGVSDTAWTEIKPEDHQKEHSLMLLPVYNLSSRSSVLYCFIPWGYSLSVKADSKSPSGFLVSVRSGGKDVPLRCPEVGQQSYPAKQSFFYPRGQFGKTFMVLP